MFSANGQPGPALRPQKKHPTPDANGLACNGNLNMDVSRLGFLIICDPDGRISESVYDELGTASRLTPGANIAAIFRPFCSREALKLVRKARPHHPVYDCELHLLGSSERDRLYCSAFPDDDKVIVIGTRQPITHSIPAEFLRLVREKPGVLSEALEQIRNLYDGNTKIPSEPPAQPAVERRRRTRPSDLHSRIASIDPAQIGPSWLLELAAHDLRNPVSGILAGSEYLMEDAAQNLEPHHRVVLTAIQSSAMHALELIHDLHEISRISADAPDLNLQPANLVKLIERAAAGAHSDGKAVKVEIDINVKKEPDLLMVDAGQLDEALRALIANAIASSRPGSAIKIVVGSRCDQAIILFRRKHPSLPASNSAASTQPRRARPKLSDVRAALLLARARSVVRAHGGSIHAKARRNEGYTVTVTLPICAAARLRSVAPGNMDQRKDPQ